MGDEKTGRCVGGPHDGEFRSYGANDMPVLSQGGDTEGDLLGHYIHDGQAWRWTPEPAPSDSERTR